MSSIFTKIIHREIPAYIIQENDHFLAFLDAFPLVKGHTLIVPKVEIDKFFDLSDNFLQEILLFAKPIAQAIEASFDCRRCGISVIGLEVPHAHLHLAPLNSANDLNFTQPKLTVSPDEMYQIQQRILDQL
jgi:histidine triad (HIT) family protein